jgi:uncharacterized protein (DUF305 family)
MIGRQQGAIELAAAGIAGRDNTDAIAMAHIIVTTQSAKVEKMTKMWGG